MIPDIQLTDAGLSHRNQVIFKNINLRVPAKTSLAILGTSGIGKTSFLRMLAGLSSNEDISGHVTTSNNISLPSQIAYMSQQDSLLPWLNVLENTLLPLKFCRHSSQEKKQRIALAHHLLNKAGLDSAIKLYPHELSGGMRQRTALVRTLMQEKSVVLMDEPFSALDTITRYHLQNLAFSMLQDKTIIFITHDPAEAVRLADKIYLMEGSPAILHLIAAPDNQAPRDMNDARNIQLQTNIFSRLIAGEQ